MKTRGAETDCSAGSPINIVLLIMVLLMVNMVLLMVLAISMVLVMVLLVTKMLMLTSLTLQEHSLPIGHMELAYRDGVRARTCLSSKAGLNLFKAFLGNKYFVRCRKSANLYRLYPAKLLGLLTVRI